MEEREQDRERERDTRRVYASAGCVCIDHNYHENMLDDLRNKRVKSVELFNSEKTFTTARTLVSWTFQPNIIWDSVNISDDLITCVWQKSPHLSTFWKCCLLKGQSNDRIQSIW